MENKYRMPSIVWLRMVDYMHAWLQQELGCALMVKDKRVICVQHLKGAKEVLMMETVNEVLSPKAIDNSISATWKNCMEAGIKLDADTIEKQYGCTEEMLKAYIPIECPRNCLTENGVIRPWTNDVKFSKRQAKEMQNLLRNEFWQAVGRFSEAYAKKHEGRKYAQVDMIEEFCLETGTPDMHVEAMRREWQRRQKRLNNNQ